MIDLLVVGAGPTGIAVGAEARRAGLETLLVERGGLTQSLLDFPTYMTFFTTRELLEIAGVPFAVPDEKPDRRQALAYYRAVARQFELPVALHQEVTAVERRDRGFLVRGRDRRGATERRAGAVCFATGYFANPKRLDVPGEDASWVESRYRDPWRYSGERLVIVGGGNSAAEAALESWRAGAAVTLVVRGEGFKPTLKYWVRPDLENRVAAGSIRALFRAEVASFEDGGVIVNVNGPTGAVTRLPADRALVLIGYRPEMALLAAAGIAVDPATLVPAVDPETCESNVPGLFVAGTLQAGGDTSKIFIENSRDHGARIVRRYVSCLEKAP